MKVIEVFPSLQGEGVAVGRPAVFVRFAGCNLCCPFCDTKYAWKTDVEEIGVDKLIEKIKGYNIPLVILTGGEPLIQPKAELVYLCCELGMMGKNIHIETNGMITPDQIPRVMVDSVDLWTVSLKFHAVTPRILGKWLTIKSENPDYRLIQLKFVIATEEDFINLAELLNAVAKSTWRNLDKLITNVNWVFQPEWSVSKEVYPKLPEWAEIHVPSIYPIAVFIPQLHKLTGLR